MFTVTGAFVLLTLVLLVAVEIGYRFAMWNRKDGGSVALDDLDGEMRSQAMFGRL